MKSLVVLKSAERDVVGIWNYSAATWGRDQADRYVVNIDRTFLQIASGKVAWQSAQSVRPMLRKVRVGRHFIFFLEQENSVVIVRVLHERMDEAENISGA